jgi:hypothetical protein
MWYTDLYLVMGLNSYKDTKKAGMMPALHLREYGIRLTLLE